VRGHVCQRLFYLLNDDYVDDVVPAEVTAAAVFQTSVVTLPDPDPEAALSGAPSPQVSLHALVGVRTENAMVLHITVKGQQLVALLDSGSTTNFINAKLCARLQLATDPPPALRVLVANGDGVPCQGVTHNVPISINTEAFSISCFVITLGSFDLILGYGPPPRAVRERLRGAPRAATRPPLRPQDPSPVRHGSSCGATIPLPALAEGRA
jgi:hypothetical protein